MTQKERWFRHYNLAKIYYKENGNLLIPKKYETKDEQGKVVKLGIWIVTQRQAYKNNKLEDWKIKLLEEIKMTWVVENIKESCKKTNDKKWLKKYNLAKKYYETYGNLLISYAYVVKDPDGKIFNLFYWIKNQRNFYKNNELEDWKMKLLEQIKIVESEKSEKHKKSNINVINNDTWMKYYFMLKDYKDTYGDIFISEDYGSNDLYNWLEVQKNVLVGRRHNDKIKISLLNDIDSNWKNTNISYLKKYIEEEYSLYLYGLLDDKNVDKLLKSGVFIYTDDKTIKKASSNEFLAKIKSR